jgi:hypothetical protein
MVGKHGGVQRVGRITNAAVMASREDAVEECRYMVAKKFAGVIVNWKF